MTSFYSREELENIGFAKIGEDVLVSKKASIYAAHKIEIGNHVRIDDFCILSGRIILGDYIHISAYVGLFAGNTGIKCEDFATISSRTVIYAESDDYSGMAMTNPMVSDKFRGVYSGEVVLKKHSIIGTGCTVLPGVTLNEGAAVGAMSLVNEELESWTMNVGIPCKKIKKRHRELLQKQEEFLNEKFNKMLVE